ncbi:MAG TPA: hypothetical protein VLG71_00070 [Candidatus Limnocylindria bacterium]|nr:hypothetical protein [Candidatus Limnocylindria bacterium]
MTKLQFATLVIGLSCAGGAFAAELREVQFTVKNCTNDSQTFDARVLLGAYRSEDEIDPETTDYRIINRYLGTTTRIPAKSEKTVSCFLMRYEGVIKDRRWVKNEIRPWEPSRLILDGNYYLSVAEVLIGNKWPENVGVSDQNAPEFIALAEQLKRSEPIELTFDQFKQLTGKTIELTRHSDSAPVTIKLPEADQKAEVDAKARHALDQHRPLQQKKE